MRPEQAPLLFRAFFAGADVEDIRRDLERIPNLAPGDFAAVTRRMHVLGAAYGARAILALLEAEVAVKRTAARPVGF